MRFLTGFVLAAIFGFGHASAEEKAPPMSDFRSLKDVDIRSLNNQQRAALKQMVREQTGKTPEFLGVLESDQELEARFKREDRERAENVLRLIRDRKVEIDRELAAKCTVRAGLFGRRRYAVWVVNGEQRRKYEKTRELLQREIERRAAEVARL